MMTVTGALVVISLIALAVFAGLIVLQIFLSKKENKWFGLILPGLCFTVALFSLVGMLLFSAASSTTHVMVNGEIIVVEQAVTQGQAAAIIANAVFTFLLMNIPTVTLMIIYAACRSKQRSKRALDKMSVQDLE